MTTSSATTWVYFILCKRGDLYIGVASDPVERFRQHASGRGAKSLRILGPMTLLGALPFASRTEALQAEYSFKRLHRARKIELAEAGSCHPSWLAYADAAGWPSFVFRYATVEGAPSVLELKGETPAH